MKLITIDMDALAKAIDSNTDADEREARAIINTVLAKSKPTQPPAEQGAELSDDQIKKIVHVGMQRSWSDTRIARELIAADRKARGGAA